MEKQNIIYTNFYNFIKENIYWIDLIKTKYLHLLSQLTDCPDIPTSTFIERINQINNCNGIIIIGYIGNFDSDTFEIVGSGTILIEPKIFREGKYVGHIEDIVMDKKYRGFGVGSKIISMLRDIGVLKSCYKIILDCDKDLVNFYTKNGFEYKNNVQLSIYYK